MEAHISKRIASLETADNPEAHKREHERTATQCTHKAVAQPSPIGAQHNITRLEPATGQGDRRNGHDWHILYVPHFGLARSRSAALQAICGYVLVAQLPPLCPVSHLPLLSSAPFSPPGGTPVRG